MFVNCHPPSWFCDPKVCLWQIATWKSHYVSVLIRLLETRFTDWRKLKQSPINQNLYRRSPLSQACIYLLKICTIPRHNHKWDFFSQFSDKYFFYYSSYKIKWQVDYIYIYVCVYVIYSYLVFKPKRFGKTRLIFIICLKGCNCCTFVDILACSKFLK